MINFADRLGELADYFMEHGSFPLDYSPFQGVMAEVWSIPTIDQIMSGEAKDPSEIRFKGYTIVHTYVTSRPWSQYKRAPQEVPPKRPLRFLDGLLYNRKRGR